MNSVENGSVTIPKSQPLSHVKLCDFPECHSFPYGIIGTGTGDKGKWVDYTLDFIAKKGGFERNAQNMPNYLTDVDPLKLFTEEAKIKGTPALVLFCTDKIKVPVMNVTVDCDDST